MSEENKSDPSHGKGWEGGELFTRLLSREVKTNTKEEEWGKVGGGGRRSKITTEAKHFLGEWTT